MQEKFQISQIQTLALFSTSSSQNYGSPFSIRGLKREKTSLISFWSSSILALTFCNAVDCRLSLMPTPDCRLSLMPTIDVGSLVSDGGDDSPLLSRDDVCMDDDYSHDGHGYDLVGAPDDG